ncbi:MAG: hypothetical protein AB7E32_00635 [Desulfovibrio sp.]
MNVSLDTWSGFADICKTTRTAAQGKDFGEELAAAPAGEEDRQQTAGLSFPGQLSKEEQQKVENLKTQAMQIAAQADGGLSAGDESRIKAIEQEINKITGMPVSENLSAKAKHVAEEGRLEKQNELRDEDQLREQEAAFEQSGFKEMDLSGQPGMAVLQQKALVTAIRTAGLGFTGVGGRI